MRKSGRYRRSQSTASIVPRRTDMLATLANHLWQSTAFALAAGLLAFSLRGRRAQTRHWIWLIASLKFLVPLSLLTSLGSVLPADRATAAPRVAIAAAEFSRPFAS